VRGEWLGVNFHFRWYDWRFGLAVTPLYPGNPEDLEKIWRGESQPWCSLWIEFQVGPLHFDTYYEREEVRE